MLRVGLSLPGIGGGVGENIFLFGLGLKVPGSLTIPMTTGTLVTLDLRVGWGVRVEARSERSWKGMFGLFPEAKKLMKGEKLMRGTTEAVGFGQVANFKASL